MPFVTMVGFVGVYSIDYSPFDLLPKIGFGVFGYVLRKMDVSLVPVILGLLLGKKMEFSLRRALGISGGDWSILFTSPIAIYAFALLMIAVALAIAVLRAQGERRRA